MRCSGPRSRAATAPDGRDDVRVLLIGHRHAWRMEAAVARALARAGHEASLFDDRRTRRRVGFRLTQWLARRHAARFRPDFVFLSKCLALDVETVAAIVAGRPNAMWYHDPQWHRDIARPDVAHIVAVARVADTFFVTGFEAEWRARGLRAAFLPAAGAREIVPVPPDPRFDANAAFIGSAYDPDRCALLREIAARARVTIRVWGPGWGRGTDRELARAGRLVEGRAFAVACGSARVVLGLNPARAVGATTYASDRVWMTLLAGGCYLGQRSPGLDRMLLDTVHCAWYTDVDDCAARLRALLADPAERVRLRTTGEAFVRAHHTYNARLPFLLAGGRGRIPSVRHRAEPPIRLACSEAPLVRHLFVTQDYPPLGGGMARRHVELCRRLRPDAVTVSTVRANDAARGAAFNAGEPYPIVRQPFTVRGAKTAPNAVRWAGWLAGQAAGAADVLHCGNVRPAGYPVWWTHRRTGIPYVVYVYGGDLLRERRKAARSVLKRWTARRIFGDSAGVVAISAYSAALAADVMREVGVRPVPRVAAIDLGTDPETFAPSRDTGALRRRWGAEQVPLLVTVARLVPHKGQDTALRALARLARDFPTLRYAIIGEGPDDGRLRALAADLGLSERVILRGWAERRGGGRSLRHGDALRRAVANRSRDRCRRVRAVVRRGGCQRHAYPLPVMPAACAPRSATARRE